MNLWTNEEINKLLIQLDELELPFPKYSFCIKDGKLNLLGRGGSADVFEARSRSSKESRFAIKVIGFKDHYADSKFFKESVELQKEIGNSKDNVVKVFDYTELWVTLDKNDNVALIDREIPVLQSRKTIKLQFVIMEKISSVISRTKGGNIRMLPETLAKGDEKEILKLAYDIGVVLKNAHDQKVLHRDVKLENVFYSEEKKIYKLGDFGIAKKTEDGFAGTMAFTKGYAAPEVRVSDERYDNTADIYSFGMMLYVLANGLKFPDSNTYNVNASLQYTPGYVVPKPGYPISESLYQIIRKACMYDPDERYQSMKDMLVDIEKLMYGVKQGFREEHKNSYLVVGSVLLAFGVVAWKLTLAPDIAISFSVQEILFLVACLGKGILKAFDKDNTVLSVVVFGIGIFLLITTGFSWPKLVFILLMTLSLGIISGYLSAGALIADSVAKLERAGGIIGYDQSNYGWVTITLISIAIVLLFYYLILMFEERRAAKAIINKGIFWIIVIALYAELFIIGCIYNPAGEQLLRGIGVDWLVDLFLSFDQKMVGLYGLGFCLFWLGRERALILINGLIAKHKHAIRE